jgi:hypothetical protein
MEDEGASNEARRTRPKGAGYRVYGIWIEAVATRMAWDSGLAQGRRVRPRPVRVRDESFDAR